MLDAADVICSQKIVYIHCPLLLIIPLAPIFPIFVILLTNGFLLFFLTNCVNCKGILGLLRVLQGFIGFLRVAQGSLELLWILYASQGFKGFLGFITYHFMAYRTDGSSVPFLLVLCPRTQHYINYQKCTIYGSGLSGLLRVHFDLIVIKLGFNDCSGLLRFQST